jgi:hypothetical protein
VRRITHYLLTATAVLALLVFATAAGEALHHHEGSSSDSHCAICHLSHQGVESAAQGHRVSALERLGLLPAPLDPSFVPSPYAPQLAARAPPTA